MSSWPLQLALGVATIFIAAGTAVNAQSPSLPPPGGETPIPIRVHEGTSMSVSVSPDGRLLAVDLQGSLWIIPVGGGEAKRITDYYWDARQPMWSPDGRHLTYFAYRDGGYHIWVIDMDGGHPVELTSGSYDDREPVWSPDGRTIAFASDRSGRYNIWTVDYFTHELEHLCTSSSEERMPTFSADGQRLGFVATEQGKDTLLAEVDRSDCRIARSDRTSDNVSAWSLGPRGQRAFVRQDNTGSRLIVDGRPVSGTENVFPFRISWDRRGGFYYVSDGRIRYRRDSRLSTVAFSAQLEVVRPHYRRAGRDWNSPQPRQVRGIVHPRISPDGGQIAFEALGDIYVVSASGGVPQNMTQDSAMDQDPAWSPNGQQIAYTSDKGGGLPQLWIRDLGTGRSRQLTYLDTQPLGAAWSPDGTLIAFIDVDGRWGVAGVCVVEVDSGKVKRLETTLDQPGTPTWSRDGRYVALSLLQRDSNSFREGTNQIWIVPTDGKGKSFWQVPESHMSIDTRGGGGPAWSPDGTRMAAIYEGLLKIWSVGVDGTPMSPPRSYSQEVAHFPTWTADSRSVLYQSADHLRKLDVSTGVVQDIPVKLSYRLANPTGRVVVHVGRLVDGVTDETQTDKDIVIDGNRIIGIRTHDPGAPRDAAQWVEAPELTAIPGLIEHHAHIQPDFGSNQFRAWLAYGVTTVRDTGNELYEGIESREAAEAGVRLSPRIYAAGPLLEWQRVYYKMGLAVSSMTHLERELMREGSLGYDLIKSYVRMPDLAQRRIVQAAHEMGIPVTTHEIFPAAYTGVDNTEHMGASSRRGYSPKHGPMGLAYEDVIQLFAQSGRVLTPSSLDVLPGYLTRNPSYRDDARLTLYPRWARKTVLEGDAEESELGFMLPGTLRSLKAMYTAGVPLAAGTDTVIAINLHSEIASYVDAGLTPFQALQTATANAARELNLEAGTIEAGKLADLVLVDGDPRENIAATFRVRCVIANGRVLDVQTLLKDSQ